MTSCSKSSLFFHSSRPSEPGLQTPRVNKLCRNSSASIVLGKERFSGTLQPRWRYVFTLLSRVLVSRAGSSMRKADPKSSSLSIFGSLPSVLRISCTIFFSCKRGKESNEPYKHKKLQQTNNKQILFQTFSMCASRSFMACDRNSSANSFCEKSRSSSNSSL